MQSACRIEDRVKAMTGDFPCDKLSAGDRISPKCSIIEVHLGEWKQLFDTIAPLPSLDRHSNVADRDAWRGDWQDV